MPDLVTHALVGCFTTRPRRYRELFFVGLILPDLLGRLPMVFYKRSYWFISAGHTPVGILLSAYLITFLFQPRIRAVIFRNLLIGASIHLFLDMLQRHLTYAYFWFFPFTWKSFEIPLFWPDQSIDAIPFLLVAVGVVYLIRRRFARAQASRSE
ncbi:MAG: hypothetical protein DRH70_09085 [Candidatus Coatesbacteria bacterium]|nr:MAG: hypothetical protein DRH70_09085 [Candidatus Coatesbacteria bacterium]